MPAMTPKEFVAKWSQIQQKETAVSQSHFNDICRLVSHPAPLEYDPTGKHFSFETQTVKPGGAKGFADVYFKGRFIWEYKGAHKDLDKAYQQLQLYREDLQNPPLLITSDTRIINIHTNFNNYPTVRHTITFDDIERGDGVQKLTWAFLDPEKFKPAQTQQEITRASADTFIAVANAMKAHMKVTGEDYTAEQLAHFMVRLLFCLFAEDLELLPAHIFTQIIRTQDHPQGDLQHALRGLFQQMRGGGSLIYKIREFDGTLFDDDFVPTIPHDLARALLGAAVQDWSQVDPVIFGTLFERVIDEDKRAQLGAHYTSVADIMLIVEPVLMAPLRQKWDDIRRQADRLLREDQTLGVSKTPRVSAAHDLLADFAAEIAAVRILDPACGSGNFLYVALRQLLDLQKQVITFAARRDLPPIELSVSPQQLYGIEVNPYAHELAQVTAWIGYLQWRHENGFGEMPDPVLRPLKNIVRMDAILAYDEDGNPVEPEWPAADVIIGNPPFLGWYKVRQELGDTYSSALFSLYDERVPASADLVCYWFERANQHLLTNKVKRIGLLATNSIRGGANRKVLDRIKESGDIFLAWSDNPWILDGAAVRVSILGFDNGTEKNKTLDGKTVASISADLKSDIDLTIATALSENQNLAFIGGMKKGPFDIPEQIAQKMLSTKNKSGRDNSDVIVKWVNALDLVRRPNNMWIIDFGLDMSEEEAQLYEEPYAYVFEHVKPVREEVRNPREKRLWWLHGRPAPDMRNGLAGLHRYIITPRVSKFRIFKFMEPEVLADGATVAFAREDDYFFGVLHSRLHEIWALRLGTSLEDRPRYTPTTSFETFPFPWPPGQEPAESEDTRVAEIAYWARRLNEWRSAWLNPPREGMYAGLGAAYDTMVSKRTLTNLYNGLVYYRETVKRPQGSGRPLGSPAQGEPRLFLQAEFDNVTRKSVTRADIQELDDIHTGLDRAVLDAYNWLPSPSTSSGSGSGNHLTDEEILEHLLTLNLQRAAAQTQPKP